MFVINNFFSSSALGVAAGIFTIALAFIYHRVPEGKRISKLFCILACGYISGVLLSFKGDIGLGFLLQAGGFFGGLYFFAEGGKIYVTKNN